MDADEAGSEAPDPAGSARTDPDRREEARLVERARAGDAAAVDALLERYLPKLETYVRLRVGRAFERREDASDIVQSVCREILQRRSDFRHGEVDAFRHWLYATAARKVADRFAFHGAQRRERAREVGAADASRVLAAAVGLDASPSQAAIGAETLARLEEAFARLADDEREVVLLSRVVGLPRRDVAEALGRTENATRNLLHRTLAKLSSELDGPLAD